MHTRLIDIARDAACGVHEEQEPDTTLDRWIFAGAWLGCVLVMVAVGLGLL